MSGREPVILGTRAIVGSSWTCERRDLGPRQRCRKRARLAVIVREWRGERGHRKSFYYCDAHAETLLATLGRSPESFCPTCNELRPCGFCSDCDPEHFKGGPEDTLQAHARCPESQPSEPVKALQTKA